MASGKYRITKIKRSWNGFKNGKQEIPKIKLTRASVGKVIYFFDENNQKRNREEISRKYLKLLFTVDSRAKYIKFDKNRKHGSEGFIFQKVKRDKNLEINHVNQILFDLCLQNFNVLNEDNIADFSISSIKLESLKGLGENIKTTLTKNELEVLLRNQLKKRTVNIRLLVHLFFENDTENKLRIAKTNIIDIYNFLSQFIYWNKDEKCTKGERKNYSSEIKTDSLTKVEVIGNRIFEINDQYAVDKTKSEYRKAYVENAQFSEVEQCLKWYDVKVLCDNIDQLQLADDIENQLQLSPLVEMVKAHYKQVVVSNVGENNLSQSEKYILSSIHDYVKGRYRKFIDILWKNSKLQTGIAPITSNDVKNIFREPLLTSKIITFLNNKLYTTPLDIGKMKYHIKLIEKSQKVTVAEDDITSIDYEYLKAKEAFLSKVGTSISMANYTVSSNLESSLDFFGSNKNFAGWGIEINEKVNKFNNKIMNQFFNSDAKIADVNTIQEFINTVVDLRLHAAHYKLNMVDLLQKELHTETSKYIRSCINMMGSIYTESLMSNNVIQFYDENDIVDLLKNCSFIIHSNSLYYPNFEKVYNEFENIAKKQLLPYDEQLQAVSNFTYTHYEEKDTVIKKEKSENEKIIASQKRQAFKFILQELYYDVFMSKAMSLDKYKELYRQNNGVVVDDIITKNYTANLTIKKLRSILQSEAGINNQNTKHLNQKWIQFITSNFISFLDKGDYQWIFQDIMSDYDETKVFHDKTRIENIVQDKYEKLIPMNELKGLEGSFIATATLIDRKEVTHLSHDIKKFIQFCQELKMKAQNYQMNPQFLSEYTEQFETGMKHVIQILEMIVKVKDRDENKREEYPNPQFETNMKIITNINIEEANIQIKNNNQELQSHNIFKDEKHYINFKGLNRIEKYGTYQFLESYFSHNSIYKFSRTDLAYINDNYNQSEELNNQYNEFFAKFNAHVKGMSKREKQEEAYQIRTQKEHALHNMYLNAKEAHQNYLNYTYAQSKYKGEQLNRAHHFLMDVYGHFLAWSTRWERDMKYFVMASSPNSKLIDRLYDENNHNFEKSLSQLHKGENQEILEKMEKLNLLTNIQQQDNDYITNETTLRNNISHFNYFSGYGDFNHSLLDICNMFYKLFSYNIKYQHDVQNVMNHIFEKYSITATNQNHTQAPVIKSENSTLLFANDIDQTITIGPKSHTYFPEFHLIQSKQVEMLKNLFTYKRS